MTKRDNRRKQTKKTIRGTEKRPRLVVFRSNKYFYAQLINDTKGETMVSVDKFKKIEEAGKSLVDLAKKKKISEIVFDRAGYQYHGNIKKFADTVREGGLVF
jgi:large subunit ribosomal protein L18